MIPLTLTEVAEITGGVLGGTGDPDALVTSAAIDSRAVERGGLFVALQGEHVDGHDYVPAAAALGAIAALTARDLGPDVGIACIVVPDVPAALADLARAVLATLRQHGVAEGTGSPVVVGITGSVGKTSTKDLLAQLLAPIGEVVAPVASFNNEIGLPLTVLRATEQTRTLVLEMGADAPGNLTFLTSIAPPDIAVELIVGHAHLGGFGSIDGVARAKAELVQGLAPGGVAILNVDDARVAAMASLAESVVTFGTTATADIRALDVVLDEQGRAELTIAVGQESARVRLALVGEHHVTNALAATAVTLHLGRQLAEIAADLSTAGPISPHRMHVVDSPAGVTVVDDAYNANPTSMRAGLTALAAMGGGQRRRVAVLGEMRELGPDSEAEHASIGAMVAEVGIELAVVVGEGARPLLDATQQAGGNGHGVDTVDDALALLRTLLQPGDIVLVKASNSVGLSRLADQLAALAAPGTPQPNKEGYA